MLTRSAATPTAPTAASTTIATNRFMVSSSLEMPGGRVTAQAREIPGFRVCLDRLDDRLVALTARCFGDGAIARGDRDGLGEPASREGERVPETVERLRRVLADDTGRRVAVVAHGHLAMTALDPAVELLAHHVAVHARSRIVRQVGGPLRVHEGVATDPDADADQHRQRESHPAR